MLRKILFLSAIFFSINGEAQIDSTGYFKITKINQSTIVKDQATTGTCWCFSITSVVESQCIKKGCGKLDLSEMFSVRNIYIEKAKNFILRQGHAQFDEGGLGHDAIRAIAVYGAIPESVYSGLVNGKSSHDHVKLIHDLKVYLDNVLQKQPIASDWLNGFIKILDDQLGAPPAEFDYNGKHYTPKTFAKNVLKFDANDYVYLTSFLHHPFYSSFIVEVPDNFSNGSYFNLPLNELIRTVRSEITNGYTVLWDADVSNHGFNQLKGFAVLTDENSTIKKADMSADMTDIPYTPQLRQTLYENLSTQDDHLMHIVGLSKSKDSRPYFVVKNSWGDVGPEHGYIYVSEPYFAVNTITIVVPRAGLPKDVLAKIRP